MSTERIFVALDDYSEQQKSARSRVSRISAFRRSILMGLVMAFSGSATAKADTVTFWNEAAANAISLAGLGPLAAVQGSRAMAMMHVAMADAMASIHPVYKPYAVRLEGH